MRVRKIVKVTYKTVMEPPKLVEAHHHLFLGQDVNHMIQLVVEEDQGALLPFDTLVEDYLNDEVAHILVAG